MQSHSMTVMDTIKKERTHLPKMNVLLVSVKYRAKMHISLFGNPAILLGQDPWLCVTRLL